MRAERQDMYLDRLRTMLLLAFIAATAAQNLSAATQVWFTVEKPNSAAYNGAVITTDLKISAVNGVVGALDLVLRYNPSGLKLLEFTAAPDAGFGSNCFVQPINAAPGQTRIACFQTSEPTPSDNPRTLGTLRWRVTGSDGSTAD